LARDDGRGKKGKCPKCRHLLVVPESTKGRPAISPVKEEMPERPKPYIPEWDKDHRLGPDDAAEALTELFKESFRFLVPTYDELSLLLMVVTLLLLYAANTQMRDQILGWIRTDWMRAISKSFRPESDYWPQLYFLYLMFLVALCFRVFRFKKEGNFKKKVVLTLAILTSTMIGIIAGVYIVRNTVAPNWLLIFPIWNMLNCVLLLLMLFFNIIDEECISDRKATIFQVLFGLASVLIIFALCNYAFRMYWAITFSICIIYTTSFDKVLQTILPSFAADDTEQ